MLHAAFDVAELEDGEGDHEEHQDCRPRRRAAEAEAFSHLGLVHLTPFLMP